VARHEVFVSYSQPDIDVAYELVSRVEAHGIECWIAPRDVTGGMEWAAEIVSAIAASKVMVLIFSASANNSPQVLREVRLAIDKGVRVVPFRIADVAPSAGQEFFLRGQHWVDAFPPPIEPHYARLCTYLNTILATPTNLPPPLWHVLRR
jgi:hypothetical protein